MKVKKAISAFVVGILALTMTPITSMAQNFQNQSDVQWVALPLHDGQVRPASGESTWLYQLGEEASIDVMPLMHGEAMAGVAISYDVAGDCMPHGKLTQQVVTGQDCHARIMIGTLREPGFRDVRMQCTLEGRTYVNHIKVGFGAEQLQPYTQEPADFDQYWANVLEEQRNSVPLRVEVTPAPEFTTDKVECQKVKIYCYRGNSTYIYGYLTKPRGEGKFAVLVSPPGAGVKPMDPLKTMFYVEKGGIIRLDLEIHGIDPALSRDIYNDVTRAFGDHHANGYLSNGLQSPDTYYMRKVYAALVRAVDYLVTLPEWDGRNILIQGNSQGAALSLVLAGLDHRITAVACAHPALSDMAAYAADGRTGGYPHFGNLYKDVTLTPEVIRTLSYYDVVNFARRVTCPVYMTWGFNDNTCPPTTSWTVWNVLRCPKEKYVTPINEHWISTETRYRQMEFLLKHLQ